jgi:WD40 repeat protein
VVTGSEDATAVVWDLRRGEPEYTIEGHPGPVTAVAAGGYVSTASGDSLRLWRPGLTLRAGLPEMITGLVVHPDDPSVLTVGTEAGGLFSYQVVDQGRRR